MKYNWTVTAGTLSEEEMAYFKKAAPAGFKPTGEALTVEYREEQNRDIGFLLRAPRALKHLG